MGGQGSSSGYSRARGNVGSGTAEGGPSQQAGGASAPQNSQSALYPQRGSWQAQGVSERYIPKANALMDTFSSETADIASQSGGQRIRGIEQLSRIDLYSDATWEYDANTRKNGAKNVNVYSVNGIEVRYLDSVIGRGDQADYADFVTRDRRVLRVFDSDVEQIVLKGRTKNPGRRQ